MGYLLESISELDHQLKKPIDSDFNSFKILLFEVKWYRLRMHEHDPERTIIEHDNGFTMVNTREFEPSTETYVLPCQCEQVFYSEVPNKESWSYVVRYDPRGRLVKYNHVAEDEDNNEEEDNDYADHEQVDHVVDVSDEEFEEVDHSISLTISITILAKMTLMMRLIGMSLSPISILNQILIQMFSWMKKKMTNI
jgi:hypothetical protein